jgi:hypothetical protein
MPRPTCGANRQGVRSVGSVRITGSSDRGRGSVSPVGDQSGAEKRLAAEAQQPQVDLVRVEHGQPGLRGASRGRCSRCTASLQRQVGYPRRVPLQPAAGARIRAERLPRCFSTGSARHGTPSRNGRTQARLRDRGARVPPPPLAGPRAAGCRQELESGRSSVEASRASR